MNRYRCLCCPGNRQYCMYCWLRNKIHRCSQVNSLLTPTDKFSILSDKMGVGGKKCVTGISCIPSTPPVPLISCSIHAKLLLPSFRFHVATVSVRQIQTAMASRHSWARYTAKWTLALCLRHKQVCRLWWELRYTLIWSETSREQRSPRGL